mmetsp:Transcript_53585/g.122643  ORF Transcript_53585/g.122643 Transcript_53585/m.122643 type:complete len:218 (+) Transcript_53585:2740-3393(+)
MPIALSTALSFPRTVRTSTSPRGSINCMVAPLSLPMRRNTSPFLGPRIASLLVAGTSTCLVTISSAKTSPCCAAPPGDSASRAPRKQAFTSNRALSVAFFGPLSTSSPHGTRDPKNRTSAPEPALILRSVSPRTPQTELYHLIGISRLTSSASSRAPRLSSIRARPASRDLLRLLDPLLLELRWLLLLPLLRCGRVMSALRVCHAGLPRAWLQAPET